MLAERCAPAQAAFADFPWCTKALRRYGARVSPVVHVHSESASARSSGTPLARGGSSNSGATTTSSPADSPVAFMPAV